MDKHIYVVFSSTPYKIGKMIRVVTREKYNHASIALDENLTQMYSFARRYQCTPFYGGFVKESSARYCRKGVQASVKIYKLLVSEENYNAVVQQLEDMSRTKEHYLYNHFSALTTVFHKCIPLRDAYTCVEFCVDVLFGVESSSDSEHPIRDSNKIAISITKTFLINLFLSHYFVEFLSLA